MNFSVGDSKVVLLEAQSYGRDLCYGDNFFYYPFTTFEMLFRAFDREKPSEIPENPEINTKPVVKKPRCILCCIQISGST